MITDKDILKSRSLITQLISREIITKADERFAGFFMGKADSSLLTAKALLRVSESAEAKKLLNLPQGYDAYMWVINTAYYSMFYAATALLASYNHKINREQGKHTLTYHALVYYFLDCDRKIAKHMLEQYSIAERQASGLMQSVEAKAREKIELVKQELSNRGDFTYEMGKVAEKSIAETSIRRAMEFLTLAKELIMERSNPKAKLASCQG